MNKGKYYSVTAKCGHVGKRNYIPITFAVVASNGKEASYKVRTYARVKHNHKDAILMCKEIKKEEYMDILEQNQKDPYLFCKSKREQKEICDLDGRLVLDPHFVEEIKRSEEKKQILAFKQNKYRMANKFNWYDEYSEYQLNVA